MEEQNKTTNESEEKLALCEKERDEYLNGWKRAKADLINSKKEWQEQLEGLGEYAKAEAVKQFFPILDALDNSKNIEGWAEIKKLTQDILKKNGVEEIEALGGEFSPVYHEAVGETEGEPNKVASVVQKGYQINGRVIRAAKVRVGKMSNA